MIVPRQIMLVIIEDPPWLRNGSGMPFVGIIPSTTLMFTSACTAIIVVTHDEKIIPTFKRIYHIRDGKTHEEAGEGRAI